MVTWAFHRVLFGFKRAQRLRVPEFLMGVLGGLVGPQWCFRESVFKVVLKGLRGLPGGLRSVTGSLRDYLEACSCAGQEGLWSFDPNRLPSHLISCTGLPKGIRGDLGGFRGYSRGLTRFHGQSL